MNIVLGSLCVSLCFFECVTACLYEPSSRPRTFFLPSRSIQRRAGFHPVCSFARPVSFFENYKSPRASCIVMSSLSCDHDCLRIEVMRGFVSR